MMEVEANDFPVLMSFCFPVDDENFSEKYFHLVRLYFSGWMWVISKICALLLLSCFCSADWPRYSRGPEKEPREEEVKAEGSVPHQAALDQGKRN